MEVTPITRAVRAALAVSVLALGSGPAFSGTCTTPDATNTVRCDGDFTDTISYGTADLTLVVGETAPSSVTPPAGNAGIDVVSTGSVDIANSANITAVDGPGIVAYGAVSAAVSNNGAIDVNAAGDAFGLYVYSPNGPADATNAGDLTVVSATGLADGIFTSGLTTDVGNTGNIDVTGVNWAAGIEAQGSDSATVDNSGTITAAATGADGHAWGIYATGGDGGVNVTTTDASAITSTGPYATGIFAYDGGTGGITVDNGGTIAATADYYATGIHAATNADGSDIAVSNSGDISALSNYGSNGIEVVATGAGASGAVDNSGNVYVLSTQYYASTSGIVVSSDGAATIANSGSIAVGYGDYAYGALALAFNGDASVTNSGEIDVTGGFTGDGALAASQNGVASVTSTGSITVSAGTATGINVSGAAGAVVDNRGSIDVASTNKYGFGIQAVSSLGDTQVTNLGDITVDGKYGFGVLAVSNGGDVAVENAGVVSATGTFTYGIEAVSRGGDVSIYNGPGGSVTSYGTSVALGLFGVADETAGNVEILNGGTVLAAPAGDYASIAIGIYGRADAGDVTIGNSAGVVATNTYTNAIGIQGVSASGDVTVNNSRSGVIATATGPGTYYASDAIGIFASAPGGTAAVYNSGGSVTATSSYGLADGIFASGLDVVIGNLGTITATGYTWAAGIEAQGENATTVDNSVSEIIATSTGAGGMAWGIYATGGDGGVAITASDSSAITASGDYATGIHAYDSGSGGVTIDNAGAITAMGTYYATGIRALTNVDGSDIAVVNSGAISAYSNYGSNGIEVVATGAGASGTVTNSGSIDVTSTQYYASSSGIVVSSDGPATIGNSGSITVGYADYAYGALAIAFNGDATVDNSGSIAVNGGFQAYGAVASSQNGAAGVTNSGTIVVGTEIGTATGISAVGAAGATVNNDGSIAATGSKYAFGVNAVSSLGDTDVVSSGDITVDAKYAFGVLASSGVGDTTVNNTGSIAVTGKYTYGIEAVARGGDVFVVNGAGGIVDSTGTGVAVGIFGVATEGDVSISNAGSVAANGIDYAAAAYGIFGRADAGDVNISNSGQVAVDNAYLAATGIKGTAALGDVAIVNSGDVSVASGTGPYAFDDAPATGIYGSAAQGSVSVSSSGDVSVTHSYGLGIGLQALAPAETASLENSGAIDVSGSTANIGALAIGGASTITNSGTIHTASDVSLGSGIGVYAQSLEGTATVTNSGEIQGMSDFSSGAVVQGATGASLTNSGSIVADAFRTATGVSITSGGNVAVSNSGDILADGFYRAIGIDSSSGTAITIDNSGSITASGYFTPVVAISLDAPTSIVNNSGTITAMSSESTDGLIAIDGSDGVETVNNSGTVNGAVVAEGGADAFANAASGLWNVIGDATDFGAGADAITNAAGGTIRLADASIRLGTGDNTFENQGTIKVAGDSLIDMGTGPDPDAGPAAMRAFPTASAVPSLNASPLVNGGVIDFLDGAPDDMLTITGDLDGDGAISIDVSPLNNTSDVLYVDGSVVDGAAQSVNVALPAGSKAADLVGNAPVLFARVSGDSTAGSFVPGVVSGYSPGGFLSLDVNISSQIDASNATSDFFAVQFEATGLNDFGSLATSIAPGAQSLMASQIGTWRQRMGVVPRTDDTGLGAFVRYFRDKGEIDPSHTARNFGSAGNFDFDQTNSGTEVGINFEPVDGINLGVTLAKSEGRQSLIAPGVGSDKIDADTYGLYGTWISPSGFYVDASYRAMGYDARLRSLAGYHQVHGRAGAINLETGYAWELDNGLNIEPQFQYTWTTVDGISLEGDGAYFRTDDADWHRGRLGVAFWKAFDSASGITWTPYGAASVVRTADGGSGYTIGDDDFFGSTTTKGTSGLVELGVGLQKNGFSATAGANWMDGGATDSFVGGQVVLRYDW